MSFNFVKHERNYKKIDSFIFVKKLTFSVQISMSSGQFMVKTWHFQEIILHFKSNFLHKSVKILRWPKNEHSWVPILSLSLDENFLSLDGSSVQSFRPASFPWFISIFFYLTIFIGRKLLPKFRPGESAHTLIFYLPWTETLPKLYINISFEVFKVNLLEKSSLLYKKKIFLAKISKVSVQ